MIYVHNVSIIRLDLNLKLFQNFFITLKGALYESFNYFIKGRGSEIISRKRHQGGNILRKPFYQSNATHIYIYIRVGRF